MKEAWDHLRAEHERRHNYGVSLRGRSVHSVLAEADEEPGRLIRVGIPHAVLSLRIYEEGAAAGAER